MSIALVVTPWGEDHAVLLMATTEGEVVLEPGPADRRMGSCRLQVGEAPVSGALPSVESDRLGGTRTISADRISCTVRSIIGVRLPRGDNPLGSYQGGGAYYGSGQRLPTLAGLSDIHGALW